MEPTTESVCGAIYNSTIVAVGPMTSRDVLVTFSDRNRVGDGFYLITKSDVSVPSPPNMVVDCVDGQARVVVTNFASTTQTVKPGDHIGYYEKVSNN